MAKIDRLIRELSGYIAGAELVMTEEVFEAVVAPYRSKPAKRPPAKRKPRKNRETPAEHERVTRAVFERCQGFCEGALDSRGNVLRSENCWGFVSLPKGHPMHTKSRGAGGEFTEANIRWGCPACHALKHAGGKPIKVTKKEARAE